MGPILGPILAQNRGWVGWRGAQALGHGEDQACVSGGGCDQIGVRLLRFSQRGPLAFRFRVLKLEVPGVGLAEGSERLLSAGVSDRKEGRWGFSSGLG